VMLKQGPSASSSDDIVPASYLLRISPKNSELFYSL
jgi:hypothetical protein